jgi:hypothetical protein
VQHAVLIDRAELARALVSWLNPVLPEGTWVEAHGEQIEFRARDGLYGSSLFDWNELDFVVERFLDGVQDDVAHATRGLRWPAPDRGSSTPLPMAGAEVTETELRFGYGSDQSPLVLAPIPLDSITRKG